MITPEVMSDLVAEAVVSSGAGLLCHGDGGAVVVGVGEGHPATRKVPRDQGGGICCVPQGGVRF